MKRVINVILFIGFLVLFISCDSWLDVSPRTEVKEDKLFSKESGFKAALLGQYIKMSSSALYGSNLTMGFMDVLAQYYYITDEESDFLPMSKYDYTHQLVKPTISSIWSSIYEIIVNLNNMLENMEKNKTLFTGNNYQIIRGEALGLRAFLHFDLLRMYAPAYVLGKDQPAIPYADRVSKVPFPQFTVRQTAEAAIKDLLEAEELLRDTDPIGPAFKNYKDDGGENAEYDSDEGFLSYRRERMNYYAVVATLARIYLYIEDHENAFKYADIAVGTNRVSPAGEIFKLYSEKLSSYSDRYFSSKLENKDKLIIPLERKDGFYETDKYGSIDNRLKSWFNYYPNSNEEFVSKYMKLSGSEPRNIPLIRGCEVYYIAAESAPDEETAYKRLNRVRNDFGLSKVYDLQPDTDDFDTELFKEYRKSFIAEGQLFYYMKRKNFTSIENSTTENLPAVYTFPKPDTEIEFGNISK